MVSKYTYLHRKRTRMRKAQHLRELVHVLESLFTGKTVTTAIPCFVTCKELSSGKCVQTRRTFKEKIWTKSAHVDMMTILFLVTPLQSVKLDLLFFCFSQWNEYSTLIFDSIFLVFDKFQLAKSGQPCQQIFYKISYPCNEYIFEDSFMSLKSKTI